MNQYKWAKFLTLVILLSCGADLFSQKLPLIKASGKIVDIRIGQELHKSNWNLESSVRPDTFDAYIPTAGKSVSFITDQDSIRFNVKPGDYHQFIVLINGKDSAFTAIKGILDVPRAKFSDVYKKQHDGKTFVEIPEIYELMNVIIALTAEGKKENGLVRKNNFYYDEVLKWFDPFSSEPVVAAVNTEIENPDNYHAVKMDAYAFEFRNHRITQSKVYDRIGFSNTNNIRSLVPELREFADKSKFLDFYACHQTYYNELIRSYRDSVGVPEMQKWLVKNFPSTRYDCFKIIFSPLVSSNQSATRFEYDGFKEAQAHVNFVSEKSKTYNHSQRKLYLFGMETLSLPSSITLLSIRKVKSPNILRRS